jgi:hypothetical protein
MHRETVLSLDGDASLRYKAEVYSKENICCVLHNCN